MGIIQMGDTSREEALAEWVSRHRKVIETELIILPQKQKGRRKIAHTLGELENDNPDTSFIAIIDSRIYQQKCADADARWRSEKDAIKNRIRKLGHVTSNAKFDHLPAPLRGRIKIAKNGCWLWLALYKKNKRGNLRPSMAANRRHYGHICFEGKVWGAHRLIYTLLIGEIPVGVLIRHDCDTPGCVNPQHLQLGITEDNVWDMMSRGRHSSQKKKCKADKEISG